MTTQNTRDSFFDDDDLAIKFNWETLERTPFKDIMNQRPMLKDTLTRTQADSQTTTSAYFLLFPRCIVQFKNNTSPQPECVLDISKSRFKAVQGGFTLTKNGATYQFTSKEDSIIKEWTAQLKGICVMTIFHDEYKAIKMIGRGSFARVYLVESKTTGKSYAVKAFTKESVIISNKNNAKPSMINEIDIMRSISHDNIIQLYEVHESEKSIYLVLELIQGSSLQDTLKKPNFKDTHSEIKVVNMIRSILDALAYLASKGIMHRDLKPDNILLDKNGKIKIVDFGLATYINLDTYIFKKCGTPGYIAPEVFKYDEKNRSTNYDDRCDVFSAGCIFFYMLFGFPFFDGADGSEILKMNRKFCNEFESISIIKREIKNPASKINKEGLNLLLELLEMEQKRRKKAESTLKHAYFTPQPSELKTSNTEDFSIYADSPKRKGSIGGDFSQATSQVKQTYQKDKYEQKDSLYIDVGQPVFNGKTDTMSIGANSNNNSLLLNQNQGGSNPNSLSKFASNRRTGGPSDLRKATILKNMQNADSESESPMMRERSSSLGRGTGMNYKKEDDSENSDDSSNENPQIQKNVDKIGTPTKHPSKLVSTGKRYLLLENRSAGNSPKNSPVKNQTGQSKFGEETKSPF